MKDSIGRDWQLGTIQLDFQQPRRFELYYTDKDGSRKTPVVIHRVIYGSLERFIGILTEHLAGAFPLWLSPVQAKVIPIAETHHEEAQKIHDLLQKAGIRSELSLDTPFGKQIRQAKVEKIPYFVIIGDKDIAAGKVTLESRDHGQIGQITKDELITRLTKEIREKK
jgi:threonyl-tRNA synthetase